MKFRQIAHTFAPIAAIALIATLSGCEDATVEINGEKGKKLAEINLAGPAPTELVAVGPDDVRIRQGEVLAITVDGDKAITDTLRFTLKDGALGIMRDGKGGVNGWKDSKAAIINVTMPAPTKLVSAGSGSIWAERLAKQAEVTIAGSGNVETPDIATDRLDVTIAGSGAYRAAGTTGKLEMTIAGSGVAAMEALKAETAEISIAGSGTSAFASDGTVNASIVGSGEVRVNGKAKCTVDATGSGRLVCEAD